MQILRTLLIIALAYYAIRFLRRLWNVVQSDAQNKKGKVTVEKKRKSNQHLNFNQGEVEDVDFEEIKDN